MKKRRKMKKITKINDLTKSEFILVRDALSERMKNIVYMKADEYANEVLIYLRDKNFGAGDDLTISYDVIFCFGDILEIIGGSRRKKK